MWRAGMRISTRSPSGRRGSGNRPPRTEAQGAAAARGEPLDGEAEPSALQPAPAPPRPTAGCRRRCFSTPARLGWRPSPSVNAGSLGDAVEEERIERHAEFLRQFGVDRVEAALVVVAVVRRGAHAGEQGRQMRVARLGEDLRQRRLRSPPGRAPRSMSLAPSSTMIASASCGTLQSKRARPSAAVSPETPALTDLDVPTLGFQRLRQHVGKRLSRRQAVAGGEAVAERHQLQRLGRRRTRQRRAPRRAPARPPGRPGERSHMRRLPAKGLSWRWTNPRSR